MNERIKELAEQSGLEFDDDLVLEPEPIYYIKQKEFEKFALLIVQECADVARGWSDSYVVEDTAPRQVDIMMKQHFGVE